MGEGRSSTPETPAQVSWRVTIRSRGQTDLFRAFLWYDQQQPGLGGDLVDEVRRCIRALEQDPLRYPVYYRGFRRMLTRRFPYKLFFRLEDDNVIVFRILHGRQDHRSKF